MNFDFNYYIFNNLRIVLVFVDVKDDDDDGADEKDDAVNIFLLFFDAWFSCCISIELDMIMKFKAENRDDKNDISRKFIG